MLGVPSPPQGVVALAGFRSAMVSFQSSAFNGGSSITSYQVNAKPGKASCSTSSLSCEVTGLTDGIAYTFSVTARNAVGISDSSEVSAVVIPKGAQTPLVVVPSRLSAPLTSKVVIQVRGGSGSGLVRVYVSGVGCRVSSGENFIVSSTRPAACIVQAIKAGSLRFQIAISPPVRVRFSARK